MGSKVSITGGTSIGTVDDIVLSDEGVVDYLIVSSGGKMVTVPWDAAKFNYEKRQATINITRDQYGKIPTYTDDRLPDYYSPTYRRDLYRYYGLKPDRERRLEQRRDPRERLEDRRETPPLPDRRPPNPE